ncbi:ABC transporter permease subunit [Streptomyces sp. 3MP-14]|uniref:ABC transporter permease subunit n=1 Tax=Streptomyces mimosae TaxID=2586635 RepID=A0A5N6A0P9_9ACTN|nr:MULTISPECIES: ABC transporter permease [Streptomyces]KAB8161772.1 ABC transporter permease subunit [Streptomyces mimosae]KAB8174960.1 ABC transporter permease subunit [Streptomyces sp. 3MP-14]
MLVFIARRLFVSIWVFLASTVVVFFLSTRIRDPLAEARQLPDGAREAAMAEISERMGLDDPVLVRYLNWLTDVVTGDLGVDRQGQSVSAALEGAFTATLQLITGATVLAIVIGIAVGVISALRQYTALDQTVTFVAFVCFSLPMFWVGTLLKQFLALDFNDWLADPTISPIFVGGISLIVGLACGSLVVGDRRSRLTAFGSATAAMAVLLLVLSATEWFADPGLGPIVIALSALGGALGFTTLVSGLDWQPPLKAALITAGIGVVAALALGPVLEDPELLTVVGLALLTVAISGAVGWFLGGELYRRAAVPASILTGVFTAAVIFTDRMLQSFADYSESVNGRPISTIGAETPNYSGTFWESGLDSVGHLALPTLALVLISLASYTRYTRASMLEVMNQDYVRTGRAKGLSERAVVTRHVLRNGLIPITTLVAYDIGTIVGGAVLTEEVFGWSAMGSLLFQGIEQGDPMPIMAFFLVAGGAIVVFNMIADIVYAFLDPRIRLS